MDYFKKLVSDVENSPDMGIQKLMKFLRVHEERYHSIISRLNHDIVRAQMLCVTRSLSSFSRIFSPVCVITMIVSFFLPEMSMNINMSCVCVCMCFPVCDRYVDA
jgi:hypothetical protein